jgi:hypothetical protein
MLPIFNVFHPLYYIRPDSKRIAAAIGGHYLFQIRYLRLLQEISAITPSASE